MIICSCNIISAKEIEQAVLSLLVEDAYRLIVPVQVYHTMQKRGKCCSCFPGVIEIIVRVTEVFHRGNDISEPEIVSLIAELKSEHEQCETVRMLKRMRLKGHRAA
ncbi:MAG: (2Fe-2S)-binding protein [Rhizobiaceae bacterium]